MLGEAEPQETNESRMGVTDMERSGWRSERGRTGLCMGTCGAETEK